MQQTSLWQLIREDFSMPLKNDPAIRSRVELIFNYPGVWALVNYRVAHALHVRGFRRFARVIMGITQMITGVDLHPGATVGRRVFLDHAVGIVVGETAVIGNDVLIYQGVTLGGVSLERDTKRHPTILDGAVIGSGAKVLGNITVGRNCRIGSNSVVVRDVPDDSTAVGIPARVIDKGRDKNPMAHNKIPDINKELFAYLVKRVALLEEAIVKDNKELLAKDKELDEIYQSFIKTIKD
ncbi:MAG: serine O-acetyltransferase [Campylobacterales bacterium]|nr:serine O-acetyltransferase [Campylobacterales bacterium]